MRATKCEVARIRAKLEARWNIKFQEKNQRDTFMLSANIARHDRHHTSISLKTYIEKQVKEHLPGDLSDYSKYPASWGRNPCDKMLMKDYEAALTKTDLLQGAEAERYGTLVGVLQFATSFRPDIAFPVGVGGRCRTFPTKAM